VKEWPFSKSIEVRFNDCDPMGHVNNAVYLNYLEIARFAYWRHVNGPPDPEGPGFILARMECDYRAAARPGDILDVFARIDRMGRTSFTFISEIMRPSDGTLIVESRAVLVVYDYRADRPVPIPDDWRAKIEEFEGPGPA
jgi:acyl-CoA thioester hydrolase